MSGSSFTESVVEEAVLAWQKALGYAVLHGPPSRPASPRRSAATRTIATWCWKVACARRSFGLLPDLPPEALEDAYRKLARTDASSLVERDPDSAGAGGDAVGTVGGGLKAGGPLYPRLSQQRRAIRPMSW